MRRRTRSICNDEIIHGTNQQLIEKYEGKAYQAQREKDDVMSHTYFQHADHYKREGAKI